MSGSEADIPSTGSPESDQLVFHCHWRLVDRGELAVSSGSFRTGAFSGSIHCNYGPLTQDKNANQDYSLAWWPVTERDERQPRLVVALADGLTNSYRSEWAAALACWVAMQAIVAEAGKKTPHELATFAFNEAGGAIARLAEKFCRDPEESCPEGQFLSTWKYILKKGGLLQTTLTLAWIDANHFNLAIIGDGGALWRDSKSGDRVLAACNLESQQVHALGPADPMVHDFDVWRQEPIDGPFLCALMTDGVGRGIGQQPFKLLDELDAYQTSSVENGAREFIARSIRDRPKDFDDNLTLAVIRG
jgi:serine/threonine protein phosphatase PrpC